MAEEMIENLILKGNWFGGDTSLAMPARLVIPDPSLPVAQVLFDDGTSNTLKIEQISDRLGNVDRQVTLSDGTLFVTSDNDGVDQITAINRSTFSKVSAIEGFHPRLIGFVALVVALFYGIYTWGLPAAASFAAWATPPGVVSAMDASSLSTLDRLAFSKSKMDKAQQDKITADFNRLVEASGEKANFKLLFRDGGRLGPNALALPAGTIILTDQLAELGSHEEVIGVLAHEVSHVSHSHSLKQLYRGLGFAALVAVLAGDLGAIAEETLTGGGVFVAMAASREMELEADSEAVPLMRKIGMDPKNLSTMLDKLYQKMCKGSEEACEETGWFSSHPGGAERRNALKLKIEAN